MSRIIQQNNSMTNPTHGSALEALTDNETFLKALDEELQRIADLPCSWTKDVQGNRFGWLHLPDPMDLLSAAAVMHAHKARLLTITAYAEERDDQDKKRSIAYHFVVQGAVITISIRIYDPNTFEALPVPSITSLFRNADWNEREFHEMFDIEIINHPNPKRLFLDERLDAGIMSSLIPFSVMSNGMSSQGLWERVMEEKAGYKPSLAANDTSALTALEGEGADGEADRQGTDKVAPADSPDAPRKEPAFTPVNETAHMTETADVVSGQMIQETANQEPGQVTGRATGQTVGQAVDHETGHAGDQVAEEMHQATDSHATKMAAELVTKLTGKGE